MGEVVSFEEAARRRRRRQASDVHARCVDIVRASVGHARVAARLASGWDRGVWMARVRKLEELEAWATGLG